MIRRLLESACIGPPTLRDLPTERPRVVWVNEWVYLGETSLLEAYEWVRCTPVEREGRKVYRVTLTRLGVREARAQAAE